MWDRLWLQELVLEWEELGSNPTAPHWLCDSGQASLPL